MPHNPKTEIKELSFGIRGQKRMSAPTNCQHPCCIYLELCFGGWWYVISQSECTEVLTVCWILCYFLMFTYVSEPKNSNSQLTAWASIC